MTTAKDYIQGIKTAGVDGATATGIALALAKAAKEWGKDGADHSLANARAVITAAAKDDKNAFLQSAGTSEIVDAYATTLIEASIALDKQQGKAEGTNLKAYMDKGAAAMKSTGLDQKLDQMMQGKMDLDVYAKANQVRAVFTGAAKEHLGMTGTYTEHFAATISTNPTITAMADESPDKLKDAKKFGAVDRKAPPPEMGGGLFEKLIMLVMALLTGSDPSKIFGSVEQPGTPAPEPTPHMQEQLRNQEINPNPLSIPDNNAPNRGGQAVPAPSTNPQPPAVPVKPQMPTLPDSLKTLAGNPAMEKVFDAIRVMRAAAPGSGLAVAASLADYLVPSAGPSVGKAGVAPPDPAKGNPAQPGNGAVSGAGASR